MGERRRSQIEAEIEALQAEAVLLSREIDERRRSRRKIRTGHRALGVVLFPLKLLSFASGLLVDALTGANSAGREEVRAWHGVRDEWGRTRIEEIATSIEQLTQELDRLPAE